MHPLFIDTGITETRLIYIKKVDTPYLDRPFHFHQNCELVLIEEGYGKRVIGDNVNAFHEGDLVMMGPNMPHIWTNDSVFYKGNKHLRARATVAYFSPHLLDHMLERSALGRFREFLLKSNRGLAIKGKARESIGRKLANLGEKDGLPQVIDFLDVLDALSNTKEAQYLSSAQFVNTYTERDVGRINSIYQFLMQNFKENIQLDEVANMVHMAPTAFCRFFKQRTNKTFSRFLNELRIKHACDLLNHPDKTISEISYESGYHNMANFNKFFKEVTGLTPSDFRRKLN